MEDVRYVTTPFRVDDDDNDGGYVSDVEKNWNSECDVTAAWLQHRQAWQRVMMDVPYRRRPVTVINRRGRYLVRIYVYRRVTMQHTRPVHAVDDYLYIQ